MDYGHLGVYGVRLGVYDQDGAPIRVRVRVGPRVRCMIRMGLR